MNGIQTRGVQTFQKVKLSRPVRFSEIEGTLKENEARQAETNELLLMLRNPEERRKHVTKWIWFNIDNRAFSRYNKINNKGELEDVSSQDEFFELPLEQRLYAADYVIGAAREGLPLAVFVGYDGDKMSGLVLDTGSGHINVARVAFVKLDGAIPQLVNSIRQT